MHKTKIPEETIKLFLENKFGNKTTYSSIDSGEFSLAFNIKVDNQDLILRLNSNNDLGFKKDKIISDNYPNIKSAKILENGAFDLNTSFSISLRLNGSSLRVISIEHSRAILPSLFENMNTIHLTKIVGENWGNWYPDLNGQFESWQERMDLYIEKDRWNNIAQKCKFIDLDLLNELYSEYLQLIRFVPKERYFLHGDFGRTNIFASLNSVTGIIDWSEAMYGDFLWDLCWLDFWVEDVNFIEEYYKFNKGNSSLNFDNFRERIKLYLIVNTIHLTLFAADRNDEETYGDVIRIGRKKIVV